MFMQILNGQKVTCKMGKLTSRPTTKTEHSLNNVYMRVQELALNGTLTLDRYNHNYRVNFVDRHGKIYDSVKLYLCDCINDIYEAVKNG